MNPTNKPNANLPRHQCHQQVQGISTTAATTTTSSAASQQTSIVPGILSQAAEEIGKMSIQSAVECAERLRTAGHYDQAIDILERTYRYAVTMVYPINQINVPILHILWQIGRTYHVASNLQRAMAIFEQVLLQAQQLSQHDIVADCLFRLAHMKQYTGDVRSAEIYYRDALHVALVIHGTKYHMDVATVLYNMGMLAHGQGDLFRAQGLYEEAIRIASNASHLPASTSSSQAPGNPNADFIANALELVVQIIESTTGLSNGIGTDERDDALLAVITQHPLADENSNALWEMLANSPMPSPFVSCIPR